jgi:drug/metabolite transporter (DMT)-like permease
MASDLVIGPPVRPASRGFRFDPTWVGLIPVVLWGALIPAFRITEERVGVLPLMGVLYVGAGVLGLAKNWSDHRRFVPAAPVFRRPALYGRWVFFVLHEGLIMSAVCLVRPQNLPFIILLNYLWPTAVILCSIRLAGVRVVRPAAFAAGCLIVAASLALEILTPKGIGPARFSSTSDYWAYVMAAAGAVSWGLYSALSRRDGGATGGSQAIPLFQLTLGLTLPLSLVVAPSAWLQVNGWWPAVLALFCAMQFIAYLAWDFGMRNGKVVVISLMADFIPWISLIATALLLQATIEPRTEIAALALVAGAMLTRWSTVG